MFCQVQINPTNSQGFWHFAKVSEYRQIWSHCSTPASRFLQKNGDFLPDWVIKLSKQTRRGFSMIKIFFQFLLFLSFAQIGTKWKGNEQKIYQD